MVFSSSHTDFFISQRGTCDSLYPAFSCDFLLLLVIHLFFGGGCYSNESGGGGGMVVIMVTSQLVFFFSTETPPPGYISEDGEASDQQMNQSMDTGTLD